MTNRFLLILTACLLVGAGAPGDAVRSELKKLQGTWKVTSLEVAGKPVPAEQWQWQGMRLTFKGDAMTLGPKGGKGLTMPIKIDPTTKPKAIDLTITRGDEKIDWKCIYSLEGDTLKFLMPLAPKKGQAKAGDVYGSVKRPESFEAKDKPFMVFTAERVKK